MDSRWIDVLMRLQKREERKERARAPLERADTGVFVAALSDTFTHSVRSTGTRHSERDAPHSLGAARGASASVEYTYLKLRQSDHATSEIGLDLPPYRKFEHLRLAANAYAGRSKVKGDAASAAEADRIPLVYTAQVDTFQAASWTLQAAARIGDGAGKNDTFTLAPTLLCGDPASIWALLDELSLGAFATSVPPREALEKGPGNGAAGAGAGTWGPHATTAWFAATGVYRCVSDRVSVILPSLPHLPPTPTASALS
jgi:hypothetical protein